MNTLSVWSATRPNTAGEWAEFSGVPAYIPQKALSVFTRKVLPLFYVAWVERPVPHGIRNEEVRQWQMA